MLKLDLRMLAELIAPGGLPPCWDRVAATSGGVGTITAAILEPFKRLMELLEETECVVQPTP